MIGSVILNMLQISNECVGTRIYHHLDESKFKPVIARGTSIKAIMAASHWLRTVVRVGLPQMTRSRA